MILSDAFLHFFFFFLGIFVASFIAYSKFQEKKKEIAFLKENQKQQKEMLDTYSIYLKGVSKEALQENSANFFQLAQATFEKYEQGAKGESEKREQTLSSLLKPLKESLEKVDGKIQELEKQRVGAYVGLRQQIEALVESQKALNHETRSLASALRTPQARGRWGEIQLKRVVEIAGMLDHCDFYEQTTIRSDEGTMRPDLLVKLPGERSLIIDSKAPLHYYLEAMEADTEAKRKEKLYEHARHIKSHILQLSKKSYWEQFPSSPEFVVLFLPGETFFSAALEHDPSLIEEGVNQRVIIATPTTLIALLRAVAYGWRQEKISQNAQTISQLGKELYKRIGDIATHWNKVGKGLDQAVASYNKAVGSLESRLLVSARRFLDLEIGEERSIDHLQPVEQITRSIQAEEMKEGIK